MRVLITVHALDDIGGVQTHVRDLATWLLAKGHTPVVYGPHLGKAAAQLGRFTIPVTNDLATVAAAPDIIHGNSAVETMTAMLHFPEAPAVFMCHAWKSEVSRPPRFPRIVRYIAVDDTCADRLMLEDGIPAESLRVLLNAVDTARFPPRATPLPAKPARALVFGNAAHATRHVPIVQDACKRVGITVDVVGELAGTFVEAPESILGRYDLIFARGRCALESLSSGAAVVVCDGFGLGGLVTSANVAGLRRLNFGIRALGPSLSVDALTREIAGYDPVDAAKVSATIRETASSDVLQPQLLALYEDCISEFARRPRAGWAEESRAAAAFLRQITAARAGVASLNLMAQATHRALQAPVIGPVLTRVARWMVDRGKSGGQD